MFAYHLIIDPLQLVDKFVLELGQGRVFVSACHFLMLRCAVMFSSLENCTCAYDFEMHWGAAEGCET
jgi:hypothetical protein